MTEPQTTLPYIHCPHCGMLIIGVVKSDKSSEVLDDFVNRIRTLVYKSNYGNAPYEFVHMSNIESTLELFQEELRTKEREG
jgi:hypothetical protein